MEDQPMLQSDFVVSFQDIDRTTSVLTDGQSLIELAVLFDKSPDDLPLKSWLRCGGLIEALIICENVLVDNSIMSLNSTLCEIAERLAGPLRPLGISSTLHGEIEATLSHIWKDVRDSTLPIGALNYARAKISDCSPAIQDKWRELIGSNALVEFFDERRLSENIHYESDWSHEPDDIVKMCTATATTVFRAHFYLELSRALSLFLFPHPDRALYYQVNMEIVINDHVVPPPAKLAVDYVAEQMNAANPLSSYSLGFVAPPVVEYVLNTMRKKSLRIDKAILHVRNSSHARAFRQWVKEAAKGVELGHSATKSRQKFFGELAGIVQDWAKDVDDGRTYKKRTLSLASIPFIGKVLSTAGLEKVSIPDPVITAGKPYLLFLNDLFQPTEGMK